MTFIVTKVDLERKEITLTGACPLEAGDVIAVSPAGDSATLMQAGTLAIQPNVQAGDVLPLNVRRGQTFESELTRETWPMWFGDAPLPGWLK